MSVPTVTDREGNVIEVEIGMIVGFKYDIEQWGEVTDIMGMTLEVIAKQGDYVSRDGNLVDVTRFWYHN